jgi:hypothetical protein
MIQARELRLGNKVLNPQNEIVTVLEIHSQSIVFDTQLELNREPVHTRGSRNQEYVIQLAESVKEFEFSELQPITLNEDILLKCGFRNFLREQWIITIGNSHIDFEFYDGVMRLRCPAPALSNVRYLHQLQNLMYSITSRELEMEL